MAFVLPPLLYSAALDSSLLAIRRNVRTVVSLRHEAALHVRREVIDAQREELLQWRDAGRLPDEGLRVLERDPRSRGRAAAHEAAALSSGGPAPVR